MELDHDQDNTLQKALEINLNPKLYGTYAEIGAGQEVARFFFLAGGASGTVAKTMSAYDMTFSDAIYGREESGRYVCESRVVKMIQREYDLLIMRLQETRKDTCYFAFADTVATNADKGRAHGWLGLKFQHEVNAPPSEIIIHAKMLDDRVTSQQEVLGILGVNLIYSAFYEDKKNESFVTTLFDSIGSKRLELDMIRVSGPAFHGVDNRILSLQLVKNKMSRATAFNNRGESMQLSDALYKKNILVLRGSFRPPTFVNMDMLEKGLDAFMKDKGLKKEDVVVLADITLNYLVEQTGLDENDFLARIDLLSALGQNVMISSYWDYYLLLDHLRNYTNGQIGVILGHNNILEVFNPKNYEKLRGGILEAIGRLFKTNSTLYVYPSLDKKTNELVYSQSIPFSSPLKKVFDFMSEDKKIIDITNADVSVMNIFSREVLKKIESKDVSWEKMVPYVVAEKIKASKLFGH